MGLWTMYRLRMRRRGFLLRAALRGRELTARRNRTGEIKPRDILLFCTLRNERIRLPWFLKYYRDLGVQHFLFVDNGSADGSAEYLADQPDVSLWHTDASYARAGFGMDWMNHLLHRYGRNHWAVVVDVDEFLVYPFCDTRPLRALTDWMSDSGLRALGTLLLDLYPKGRIEDQTYSDGQNPFEIASWFDSANYSFSRNARMRNLWIQGGPRARAFFPESPARAPALNKIPLVFWKRGQVYASSTHMLLPRGLNQVYDPLGGEKASGCLLHAKSLPVLRERVLEESSRSEHYAGAREYRAYAGGLENGVDLWSIWSERYINWRQLELLGLMSKGNWA